MAGGTLRKFLFLSDEGYFVEQQSNDLASFGKITLSDPTNNGGVTVDAGGGKIVNVPDVTTGASGTDAVNKNYVDSATEGLGVLSAKMTANGTIPAKSAVYISGNSVVSTASSASDALAHVVGV